MGGKTNRELPDWEGQDRCYREEDSRSGFSNQKLSQIERLQDLISQDGYGHRMDVWNGFELSERLVPESSRQCLILLAGLLSISLDP